MTQSTNIAKLHWCKFDSTQVHQRVKIIKLEGKGISLGAKTDITEKHSCKNTNTKITICNHKHTIWLQERGIIAKLNIFHFVKSCSAFSDVGEKQGKIFHTLFSVWWGWPKIGQIDWNDTCARAVSCNFCCQVDKLRLRKPQQSTHWKILFMRVRSQIETGSWRSNFIASAKLSLALHYNIIAGEEIICKGKCLFTVNFNLNLSGPSPLGLSNFQCLDFHCFEWLGGNGPHIKYLYTHFLRAIL